MSEFFKDWAGKVAATLGALTILALLAMWRDVGANTTHVGELKKAQQIQEVRAQEDHDNIVQLRECVKNIEKDIDELKDVQYEILEEIRNGR